MTKILLLLASTLIILSCSNTKKGLGSANELISNNEKSDSTKISNNVITDSNKVYYLDGKPLKLSTKKSQSIKEVPKNKKTK